MHGPFHPMSCSEKRRLSSVDHGACVRRLKDGRATGKDTSVAQCNTVGRDICHRTVEALCSATCVSVRASLHHPEESRTHILRRNSKPGRHNGGWTEGRDSPFAEDDRQLHPAILLNRVILQPAIHRPAIRPTNACRKLRKQMHFVLYPVCVLHWHVVCETAS